MPAGLDELAEQLLCLPIDERATLAQRLWASLEAGPQMPLPMRTLLSTIRRRSAELDSGGVEGRPHSEVMAAARRPSRRAFWQSGT